MKTEARTKQEEAAAVDPKDEWLGAFVTMRRVQEHLRILRQIVKKPGEKKALTAMINRLQQFARYANAAAQVARAVNARRGRGGNAR